jgi:uncharacterized protein (TIGR02996 family)
VSYTAAVDDVERAFLDAIIRDPEDYEARIVYADWLEQRGDPRGEYLRLEALQYRIPGRLAELEPMLEPAWLASVGRRYEVVLAEEPVNKITCIKVVREVTGRGLREAKDMVDAVRPGRPSVIASDLDRAAAERIVAAFGQLSGVVRIQPHVGAPLRSGVRAMLVAVLAGQQLAAIKLLREHSGLGVAACKEAIAQLGATHPVVVRDELTRAEADALVAQFRGVGEIRLETVIRR